jgi:hypothetical protein
MYKINRDKTVCEGLVFLAWCFVYVLVVLAVRTALERLARFCPLAEIVCVSWPCPPPLFPPDR